MDDAGLMAAIEKLPDAELMRDSKITDPVGSDTFYSARTVAKLLAAEREACKAEATAAAEFEVAAAHGLKIDDASQLSAYRNGWSHSAQHVADRIAKRGG